MVRSPSFHYGGHGFVPGQGTETPHAAWQAKSKSRMLTVEECVTEEKRGSAQSSPPEISTAVFGVSSMGRRWFSEKTLQQSTLTMSSVFLLPHWDVLIIMG